MRTIVIYYSLDGNTKYIAETITKELSGDILELKTTKELLDKDSFMKYLWGGKMVYMKEEPELIEFNIDFSKYDLIIIGTPVWAFNYTPPLATFFSKYKLENKNIAIFCCHSGGMGKTLNNMREKLNGNNIISEINFIEPLKRNKEESRQKLEKWIENLRRIKG